MSFRIQSSWPDLFLQVVEEVVAQLRVPVGQARADGHQQRHGVPHVVPGLRQEGQVAGRG